MKVDSNKKAVVAGILLATFEFLAFVLFTYFLYYLLKGENFVYKSETKDSINGISFNVVMIVPVVISAIIPILLIRYKKTTKYELSIFIAVILYIAYFVAYFVFLSSMPAEMASKFPMNSFDALVYGIFNFPLGAIIGILLNIGVNYFFNRKQ